MYTRESEEIQMLTRWIERGEKRSERGYDMDNIDIILNHYNSEEEITAIINLYEWYGKLIDMSILLTMGMDLPRFYDEFHSMVVKNR